MRNTIQLRFDRNRNLLFDLFGSAPRPLGDNPYVFVGHIGISFDGKIVK